MAFEMGTIFPEKMVFSVRDKSVVSLPKELRSGDPGIAPVRIHRTKKSIPAKKIISATTVVVSPAENVAT